MKSKKESTYAGAGSGGAKKLNGPEGLNKKKSSKGWWPIKIYCE